MRYVTPPKLHDALQRHPPDVYGNVACVVVVVELVACVVVVVELVGATVVTPRSRTRAGSAGRVPASHQSHVAPALVPVHPAVALM